MPYGRMGKKEKSLRAKEIQMRRLSCTGFYTSEEEKRQQSFSTADPTESQWKYKQFL